jgi:hypothetical protein
MPSVGFEPMILASEQGKTVHALDLAASVIGNAPKIKIITCSKTVMSEERKEVDGKVE